MTRSIVVIFIETHEAVGQALKDWFDAQVGVSCPAWARSILMLEHLIESHKPDVLVFDLFCGCYRNPHTARDMAHRQGMPSVVILSELCAPLIVRAALNSGVRAFVSRTDHPSNLLTAVRTAADGRRFLSPSARRRPGYVLPGGFGSSWPPRLGDTCPYCARRCRIPVTAWMPLKVIRSYELAGLDSMGTCPPAAHAERVALGVSYDDVVDDRIRTVRATQVQDPLAAEEHALRTAARESRVRSLTEPIHADPDPAHARCDDGRSRRTTPPTLASAHHPG